MPGPTAMKIRPLEPSDGQAMVNFAAGLSEEEITFLKDEQVTSSDISQWATHPGSLRLIAIGDGGCILGYIAVLPGAGMSNHVGEILLVVSPSARRQGIGRTLARHAMVASFTDLGLSKLVIEIAADQTPLIAMFTGMGFAVEALLRDHIRESSGALRDLLMLSHLADEGWADFVTLGISREQS